MGNKNSRSKKAQRELALKLGMPTDMKAKKPSSKPVAKPAVPEDNFLAFLESQEAKPSPEDDFMAFLAKENATAAKNQSEAEITSGGACNAFFGRNDVASTEAQQFERESAEAIEVIKQRVEIVEAAAGDRSPIIVEETRAERRARLLAEQRALMASDSESEEEEEVESEDEESENDSEEEESAESYEEEEETEEDESEDPSETESESIEAVSEMSDGSDESCASSEEVVREKSIAAIRKNIQKELVTLDDASDTASDMASDVGLVLPGQAKAKFTPNESFCESTASVNKTATHRLSVIDDDCEDIKYASIRKLRQRRPKASPKVKTPTAFKSVRPQRIPSVRCPKFGRKTCPGLSKTAPGPGSYNVNYSSFGTKKSFSTRKCTFGGTPRSAQSTMITRNGQIIYKTKTIRRANRKAGVRTVNRPAWAVKQKQQPRLTPQLNEAKRQRKTAGRRAPQKTATTTRRSPKSKKVAAKKVAQVDAESLQAAEALKSLEALRERKRELELAMEETPEEDSISEADESVPEAESDDESEDESCDFDNDDVSDMDSIAKLLRSHGVSGY